MVNLRIRKNKKQQNEGTLWFARIVLKYESSVTRSKFVNVGEEILLS